MKDDIEQALAVLQQGGLILYPTDTIWGIGCDATNAAAVAKIYALKKRDDRKAMNVLIDQESRLNTYIKEVPEIAYQLIDFAENPLTIIYPGARNLAENVVAEDGSIGIRIVRHPFCEKLIGRLRKPLVSTSANLSGEPSPKNFAQVSGTIRRGVDYVVKNGQEISAIKQASTIIKLELNGTFQFIRR